MKIVAALVLKAGAALVLKACADHILKIGAPHGLLFPYYQLHHCLMQYRAGVGAE